MKNIFFSLLFILFIIPAFSQENIDVKQSTLLPDNIITTTRAVSTKIADTIRDEQKKVIQIVSGLRIVVFRDSSYTEYTLLDSVFRYDSLLPTEFNDYNIAEYGNYEVQYDGYDDDGYDDYDDVNYDDGYDDGYDNNYDDGYDDGYGNDEQYDDELQDDYQVDEDGNPIDSTEVGMENDELIEGEEDLVEEEDYSMDSSYVFLGNRLDEIINYEDIISLNFDAYVNNALINYEEPKGHKVHKISILDTLVFNERDSLVSFELNSLDWDKLRLLPLKVFVGQSLNKFGTQNSNYIIEMDKPLTYEAIYKIISNTNPDFDIDKVAWEKLKSFDIDPNQYLADIVWISYLTPYYAKHIKEVALQDLFLKGFTKKIMERIIEFEEICSYDFKKERSFKNIIQDTTILKNPRFERVYDEGKKAFVIKDNSLFAYQVEEKLNTNIGNKVLVYSGVISTVYKTEEISEVNPRTGKPVKITQLRLDVNGNPELRDSASFGITFKHLSLESLKTVTNNMKYDISKLTRGKKGDLFVNQKYLWKKGLLKNKPEGVE